MTKKKFLKKKPKIIIKKKSSYKNIFDKTQSKEQFIQLMLKTFPELKLITIKRRYYDFVAPFPKVAISRNISYNFLKEDVSEPPLFKRLIIQDAKRLHYKITTRFLEQQGFNQKEINWLLMKGEVE